jgi:dipeptidyl aminopeptidase/acylaminoacyl peptidase
MFVGVSALITPGTPTCGWSSGSACERVRIHECGDGRRRGDRIDRGNQTRPRCKHGRRAKLAVCQCFIETIPRRGYRFISRVELVRLLTGPVTGESSWRGENPTRLLIRDAQTEREMALASHPVWNLYQARFSADGNWVVFHTTNTPTLRQIYIVPARQQDAVPVERWIAVVSDFGIQPMADAQLTSRRTTQ